MDNKPFGTGKVSIVIPCYNQGSLLLETLASIDRVRNENVAEIIIVNDGSSDATSCQVIRDLDLEKYRVIHQANRGLAGARNAGIKIAKGEFILPLDGDDLIRSLYLDRGVVVLTENPEAGVVHGDAQYFGEKTGRGGVKAFDWRTLVQDNYIYACALFRRSAWESVGGYDENMRLGWEDWEFWMRLALHGWKFVHLDEVAFDYRKRNGSMISETMRNGDQIIEYMFAKPGNEILRALREQGEELARLDGIQRSKDYRVGRLIVNPLRVMKRGLSGSRG